MTSSGGAADEDVLAASAADGVGAADDVVGDLDVGDLERGRGGRRRQHGPGDEAVVADDEVVAGTRGDGVAEGATEDDVEAAAGGDGVGAADRCVGGLEHCRTPWAAGPSASISAGTAVNRPLSPRTMLRPFTSGDGVGPLAADDDVVARCRS